MPNPSRRIRVLTPRLLPILLAIVVGGGGGLILSGCKTGNPPSTHSTQPAARQAPPLPAADLPSHHGDYTLDQSGRWVASAPSGPASSTTTAAPAAPPTSSAAQPSTDEATIRQARALLAADRPAQAWRILDSWITAQDYTSTSSLYASTSLASASPLLPQAFLLRGDALLASNDEYRALYDYERVIIDFPGSAEYARAVQRELEIGIRYLHGLRRRLWGGWGPRMVGASDVGEELLVRVQERMPGSALAERAGIELADYYYRSRDLAAASEAYEVFLINHPRSEHAPRARQLRIFSNIALFKGPDYDSSGLTEARILIEEYAAIDPVGAQRAGLSDALTARLEESAAAQQLQKVRWYLTRGDAVSARFMLRRIVQTHPRTVSADVALEMLEERGWGEKK